MYLSYGHCSLSQNCSSASSLSSSSPLCLVCQYSPECCSSAYEEDFVRMWKRAVWLEGKKEEEGVVPSSWVLEENQTLFWPQGVNAENALHNQQEPDPCIMEKVYVEKSEDHFWSTHEKKEKTLSCPHEASLTEATVMAVASMTGDIMTRLTKKETMIEVTILTTMTGDTMTHLTEEEAMTKESNPGLLSESQTARPLHHCGVGVLLPGSHSRDPGSTSGGSGYD
ncbi:hypothetical protein O3P69_004020 [Scylla paramamosain]|uniref:Uncharacterized protein n=1 Tax=Scylla paramamosain TaxID=85552 RepID=A0AAW0UH03_SCYPA